MGVRTEMRKVRVSNMSVGKREESYRYANQLGNSILICFRDLIFSSVRTLLDVAYPCQSRTHFNLVAKSGNGTELGPSGVP